MAMSLMRPTLLGKQAKAPARLNKEIAPCPSVVTALASPPPP